MATRTAQSSGNWADVWDTLPDTGDDIDLAGYTVTIPNGYTTAVIRQGAGTSQSVGASGSTLDIKNGGKLRYSGVLRFNSGCVLKTQGGATLEVSPATDGAAAYCKIQVGSTWTLYDNSDLARITFTRSGANKSNYTILLNDSYVAQLVEHVDFAAGGYVAFYGPAVMRYCDVSSGGAVVAYRSLEVHSCYLRGNAAYGINAQSTASLRLSNVVFGRDAAGNADPHATASITSTTSGVRIHGSRIACFDSAFLALTMIGTTLSGITDFGFTDDDGYMVDNGDRGTADRRTPIGLMSYTPGGGAYQLTPGSNAGALTPLRWPDEDITGLLSAPIPAAEGQAVSLSVPVTLNASQTADSVRLILDPDNMYGCYAVSAQATPSDATTELTAAGTVAAGVSNVLIPWRIEINAYASGGVVDVESASVNVAGVVSTLDQRSMRWIPPVAPTGGGRRRCDFAGVRFAT